MSVASRIFSFFKSDSLSGSFNTRAFDQNVSRVLWDKSLPHARQVGGTFELDDAARASLKGSIPSCPPFASATVVVVDRTGSEASAYMIGQLTDGSNAIISLQNYGRPDDIAAITDKFTARRSAHNMRQHLGIIGSLKAPERNFLYTPKF